MATTKYIRSADSDLYETPNEVWDLVLTHVPKRKIFWEPFRLSGKSGAYMRSKGYKVIDSPDDFFAFEPPWYDLIVSNPPYSLLKEVLERIVTLGKPFALLLPATTLATSYAHKVFRKLDLQLIVPEKRVQYDKVRSKERSNSPMPTMFYCSKLKLPAAINYSDSQSTSRSQINLTRKV